MLTLCDAECCEEAAAAIPALVGLLASDQEVAPGYAAAALGSIVNEEHAADAAVDCGAVPALVQLLLQQQQHSAPEYMVQWTASVLPLLASVPGAAEQLEAAGGVAVLVQLLGHSSMEVQHAAAWAVDACAHQLSRQMVAAGAIRALLGAVRSGTACTLPLPRRLVSWQQPAPGTAASLWHQVALQPCAPCWVMRGHDTLLPMHCGSWPLWSHLLWRVCLTHCVKRERD